MHFPVTVITENGDYDTALEPFSEHIEVAPYIDKTKEELIKEKRKELAEARKSNPGSWLTFLESAFDWTNDETLFESIMKRDKQDGVQYDEFGNRLSTYNPQSRWDWYQLGGRWANFLHIKNKKWKADESRVKNIDFNAYKLDDETYKSYVRQWEVLVDEKPLIEGEKITDYADMFTSKDILLSDYGDYNTYMKCMNSFLTWNLLYEGVWYRPEEDSLICNNAEKNKKYLDTFFSIMSNLNPDHYISIVDCHI